MKKPTKGFKPVPRESKYLSGLWQRFTRGDLVTLKRGKVYKATSLTKYLLGVVQRVEGRCVWVCDDPNQLYEVEYEI